MLPSLYLICEEIWLWSENLSEAYPWLKEGVGGVGNGWGVGAGVGWGGWGGAFFQANTMGASGLGQM